MDIKSKKYNRANITGIIIAGLAAALFVMLFPVFERRAEENRETQGREWIESTNFIQALVKSNYVFYKNVRDKGGDKIYSYEELYMDKSVEELEADVDYDSTGYSGYDDVTYAGRENSIAALYIDQIQNEIASIQDMYVSAIERSMDYYVLDKSTGISIKNTSAPIEELLGSAQEIRDIYEYYVIMEYDKLGNLTDISVKGQDADKLFKTVRGVEGGSGGRLLHNRYETETFGLYDNETDRITGLLKLKQKKPENAVFIYAITYEQRHMFDGSKQTNSNSLDMGVYYPTIYSYYNAGIDTAFALLMAAIFIITFMLAALKPDVLEGIRERKMPIEVILIAGPAFIELSLGIVVDFAAYVIMEGHDVIPWANYIVYDVVKYAVSFIGAAFAFGIWYFLCLEASDIMRGIRKYIQTRCLVYICLKKICSYIKKSYDSLKADIKNADLGKDMNRLLKKLVFINLCLLTVILLSWAFGFPMLIIYSFVLYYLIKKYILRISRQYKNLLEAVDLIAGGSLNNTFEEEFGIFESSKEKLYEIQNGFKNAVDKEVKSRMMKTELITNVSHDLKTPLTAIITYIDLMKDENITEEQRREYLDTLERKSQRLKALIDDLFEMSRATSGNINLELIPVNICSLMRQVYLEHEDKMEQAGLQVRFIMPEEKIILKLDSQKTYRIFENLYVNIVKYAMPNTRVFITAEKKGKPCGICNEGVNDGECSDNLCKDFVRIEIKNISAQEIVGDPQRLSERFVRGDASRNTEGSGLGLAIARSFTELQGGTFRIESDGDLFKVILEWGGQNGE